MSASTASFLLPDTDPAWRLWKSLATGIAEPVDIPAECRESSRPIVVGLPATACRTVGLVLPTTDETLIPAMVEAQLERRGIIVQKSPAPNYAWHVLGHDQAGTFISVDVLAAPFPVDLAVKHAANYTTALRMMQHPQGELVVSEEQGLVVLSAGHQGKLWHSHIIGATETEPSELAREIQLAKLTLESHEGTGVLRGALLVGERLRLLAKDIQQLLPFPVETLPRLEPNRALQPETFPLLLPGIVHDAQTGKKLRQRIGLLLAALAAGYALAFLGGWWHLQSLQSRKAAVEQEVAGTEGPAAEIRKTDQRWRALHPATDSNRYAMVQLSQITTLMPPSGVQLKKFIAKISEIEIQGDARDAQTATQLLEDLKQHPQLSRFEWSMPVPSMREKVASFKIQGKLPTP